MCVPVRYCFVFLSALLVSAVNLMSGDKRLTGSGAYGAFVHVWTIHSADTALRLISGLHEEFRT